MIHVGQSLQNGGDPDVALMARAIEEAGLDGVWCGDHLAFPGQWLDSPTLLGAAAAVTERVTVGWSVMLPALRPPAWAAKQVASVQRISNGRLQLGVGLGRPGPEWQIAGTTQTGRAARTDAFLAALPDLLAGRPADPSLDGTLAGTTLGPAVPMPPLWIGGVSDAALRRTVRFGAGWLASPLPPDRLAARARELAALAGPDQAPPRVATGVFAAPGLDAAESAERLHGLFGLDAESAAALALGGSPEQLAEGLARYRDAGADTLVVIPFGTDPFEAAGLLGRARALLG